MKSVLRLFNISALLTLKPLKGRSHLINFKNVRRLMAVFCMLSALAFSQTILAQGTLGTYVTTGLSGGTAPTSIAPSSVAGNVTFSTFTRGNGITAIASANEFASMDFSTATTLSIGNNDYFEFTITPGSCFQVSLSAVRFDLYRGSQGPANLALRSSVDAFATTIVSTINPTTSAATYSISLAGASFQNFTTAITFRLYGWNASTAAGSLRLTDADGDKGVEVDGTTSAIVSAPTGTGASRCGTGAVTISATPGSGQTIDWYANSTGGSALASSTTSFTTPSISTTTTYYAQARNTTTGCISATRTAVVATINNAPAITVQPTAQTVCSSPGTASFTVSATGTGLTYQWRLNGANLSDGANISGSSTLTLNLSNLTSANTVIGTSGYECVVSGTAPCAAVTSSRVALTVNASPSIGTQPAAQTACSTPGTASFTIVATGTSLTYQWRLNGVNLADGTNVSGSTLPTLSLSNLTISNTVLAASGYECIVSGAGPCSVTSTRVALTVNTIPAIATQPTAQSVCSNPGTASFTVSATGTGLTYQWRLNGSNLTNGTNVSGSGTSTLNLSNLTSANTVANTSGYECIVSGAAPCAAVTSARVALTVTTTPSIATQPTAQTTCSTPGTASFTIAAAGTGLTYQWRLNGVNLTDGANVSGSTTLTLGLSNLTSANTVVAGAGYDCVVTGTAPCTFATSTRVALTVNSTGTWLGGISTDWNTASNWCGGVPTSSIDVIIPSGTPNSPNIIAFTANCKSLIINSGATLVLSNSALSILNINGNFANGGTFTGGTLGTVNFAGSINQTVTGATTFPVLAVTAGTTLSLSSAVTAAGGVALQDGATAGSSITGAGTLTLGGNVTVSDAGTGTDDATITCPVTLTNGQTRTFNVAQHTGAPSDLTISGVISTTGGIIKTGTGTMVLSNASNSYSGGTTISGGVLSISADANLGTAAVTLTNGAMLRSTSNISLTKAITLGSGGGAVDAPVSLTLTGNITGANALVTSGELIIQRSATGTNAVSSITINSGRVHVFTAGSIGSSSFVVKTGAVLDIGYAAGTFSNIMNFNDGATLSFRGTGTLTINTANVTFPGAGSTMIFNSDDANTNAITVAGNYTLPGDLTLQVGPTGSTTVGIVTMSGVISGGAGSTLNKSSTGTLILSGANTYTAAIHVIGGTLQAGSTSAFGSGSAVTLDNTAGVALNLNSNSNTIGSLTGGGTSGGNVTLGTAKLTIGTANSSPATYAGIISGSGGSLAKSGSGALTLSGANTYTGGTNINAGALNINSTTALGASTGTFSIVNGAIANVNSNITVGSLTLGGLGAVNGTWGSTSSSATNKNNTYFSSTAVVTVTNDTRATPTVTPTVGTYTYNGSAQGPNAATNTGTGTSYTFSYSGTGGTIYGPSATQPTNAGNYTVTVTVAASSDGFYKQASSSATAFTIAKATPTVTPIIGTYTYNGSAQGPNTATNSGTGTSYTFSYIGVSGTTYGPSATRPANSGNYTVTVTLAASADGNYSSASSGAIAFTIGKATPTVTPTVGTYTFNNTLQGPNTATNTGTGTSYTFSYSGTGGTTYGPSTTRPTNAGSYTVTATVAASADGNYNAASSSPTAFTIGKANSTITVTGATTYTYDGTPKGPATSTVVGSAGAVTYSYTGTGSTTYTASATLPTDPGTYSATATLAADANYNGASSSPYAFTIGKANSTITVTGSTTFTYDGTPQGPETSTVVGSTGAVTYSYVGTSTTTYGANATKPTGAGTYSVTATVAADANYNGASSSQYAFTIGKANSTITATGTTSFTYNGTPQGPSTSTVVGSTGAVTYSYAGTGSTTYAASATEPTDAGTYSVTATVAADANYNGASSSPTGFTIAPAALSITANDESKCEGQTFTFNGSEFSHSALQNSETVTNVTLTSAGSTAGAAPGTYSIVPSAPYTGTFNPNNYSIILINGTLIVNPSANPGTVSGLSPLCSGATATYTSTGDAGGVWSSTNTSVATVNSSTGVVTAGGAGTANITYTLNSGCGSPVSSNQAITINSNTWTGVTSTDWNDGANWSCGVPSSVSDVIIPDVSAASGNNPIIGAADLIRNITLATGASLSISTSGVFTITGTYSNSGTLTNNGKIILNGNVAQSFPGANATIAAMNELEVNNTSGVTIDKSFILTGVLTPTAGNIALGNNNITLHSDANLTARVAQIPTVTSAFAPFVYTGTGRFIVEQYIHNPNSYNNEAVGRTWRFMTTPLAVDGTETIRKSLQNNGAYVVGAGTLITGPGGDANGFDLSNNKPSFKIQDPADLTLISVPNTTTSTVSNSTYTLGGAPANQGYFIFIRGDRNPGNLSTANSNSTTLSTTGKLQTGNMQFVFPSASNTAGAFTMLPNPYASPVDFDKVWNKPTTTNILRTFFAWNPKKNLYAGGYVTVSYNSVTGKYDNSDPVDGSNTQTQNIQSNQTVYVQTATPSVGPTAVAFAESDKSTVYNNVFRPASVTAVGSLRVNLDLADAANTYADGALLQFNPGYSNGVDALDAIKFDNPKENIALLRDGKSLSIERRNIISAEDTMFFKLWNTTARGYRFDFIVSDFGGQGLTAFLVDSYLKTSTPLDLSAPGSISFSITSDSASAVSNRFKIVFKQSTSLPVTFTSVKAYQQSSNINVDWKVENEVNMKQYVVERSADGKTFTKATTLSATKNNGSAAAYQWIDANPFPGNNYYRVIDVDINGKTLYSNVIKVFIGKGKPELLVYPNPVINGNINLQLVNQPAGTYFIRLTNKLGQAMITKQITHTAGSSTETLQMDKTMAHGTYQLEITRPDKSQSNINVLY